MSKKRKSTRSRSTSIEGSRVREPIAIEDARPPDERVRVRKIGEKMIAKYDAALRELAKK